MMESVKTAICAFVVGFVFGVCLIETVNEWRFEEMAEEIARRSAEFRREMNVERICRDVLTRVR